MKIIIYYYQADADEKRKTQKVEAGEGARYIKPVRDDPRSVILSLKADDEAVAQHRFSLGKHSVRRRRTGFRSLRTSPGRNDLARP